MFNRLFLKIFIFLEFSLLILMLGGIFWFSRNYYLDYYDRMKHQAWVVSSLIKSNLASSVSRSRLNSHHQIFSDRIKKIASSFSEIRALFLLNPLTSQIVAHSEPNLSGRYVRDIYPSLNTKVPIISGKAGVFKGLEIDWKERFEYKYFYKYAIPDQMKHPLYIVDTWELKNELTGRTAQSNVYLIWNTPLGLLFTWTDFLLYAFVITNVSFLLSYLLDKSFRYALSQIKETKIEKVKKPEPEKAREFNQIKKPHAQGPSKQKFHKKQRRQKRQNKSRRHKIQSKAEKKPKTHPKPAATHSKPTRQKEEEIPEAIFLD